MKKLRLLIVANNLSAWTTWYYKTEAIQQWALKGNIDLEVSMVETNFTDIPFIDYNYTSDQYDKGVIMGNNMFGIHPDWYDKNVSVLGLGYNIIAFIVTDKQWKGQMAAGWRYDHNLGPIELQLKSTGEFQSTTKNGKSYLLFLMYLKHELSHAFYELAQQPDRTHEFYYGGDWYLEQAIQAIKWPEPKYASDDPVWWANFLNLLKYLRSIMTPEQPKVEEPKEEPKKDLLNLMCLAIQKHEGWFEGSRSWRNKNPGNLRYVGQAKAIGKDKSNFAVFATYEDGFNTLKGMIKNAVNGGSKVYKPDMTLNEFFAVYAPAFDENDPQNYAKVVAKEMGVEVSFQIKNLVV